MLKFNLLKNMKKVNYLFVLGLFIGVGIFSFGSIKSALAETCVDTTNICDLTILNTNTTIDPRNPYTITARVSCSSPRKIGFQIRSYSSCFTSFYQPSSNSSDGWYSLTGTQTYQIPVNLSNCASQSGITLYIDAAQCDPQNSGSCACTYNPEKRFASDTRSLTLNFQQAQPCTINSFTANPSSISYNSSTNLSWSTSNCNSCTAYASPYNSYWTGSQSTSGNKTVYNLTQNTTFTLSCSGSNGSDTKSVMVNVGSAPDCRITSFYANPNSLTGSGNSNLNWSTSNCNSCTASAQPSFGGWTGNVNVNGSKSVYLTQTTSFTLCCQGQGSNNYDSKTITVNVNDLPTLNVSCSASPNPAQINQTVTFTANVSGGISPYSYSWSGAVSGNSSAVSKTFNSAGTYTAYLTVYDNASQSKSTSCSVTVNEIPVIRYACNTSTWQCYQSSTGPYTSLSACQADCQYVPPPQIRYACNTNTWQCYQSSSGSYTSLSACQADCQYIPPPVTRYACNTSSWQCYQSSSGQYTSLSACQTDCVQPVVRYACNTSTWQCYQSSTGPYTSLSACQNDCVQPVVRYACNTSTWQCYQSSTGQYTSLTSCQTNCQQPLNCQITNFTANPNPISSGDNTILNWNSSNCSYCNASASPSNTYWIGSKAINGSTIVYNLTQVTTFNLTCYGQNNTDTKSLTVNLSQNPSLNVSCWASPNPVQINQNVTFYSSVSNGSGNYYYYWSGAASGNAASYYRSFSSNGTYWAYLTVTDSWGRTGSASCSVYVEGQNYNYPTLDFWADKYSLIKGESTYLRWTSSNTNYCTASNGWSGSRLTNGYELVSPTSQTTYTLTCYGNNGSVTKSLTIYVSEGQNIGLTKLGRNLTNGDRSYEKTIRLADGEVAEFYLAVSAINSDLTNVVIKDILPQSLTYMNGTTKINGVVQPDTIASTGLSLGNISRGTSKIITFQALSSAPGYYLSQTNTAEVTANGQNKVTDTATIVFGMVLGAATVKTGPEDSLLMMLLISFGLASVLFYYFTYNPKGKLVFNIIQESIRNYHFERTRQKLLKRK